MVEINLDEEEEYKDLVEAIRTYYAEVHRDDTIQLKGLILGTIVVGEEIGEVTEMIEDGKTEDILDLFELLRIKTEDDDDIW